MSDAKKADLKEAVETAQNEQSGGSGNYFAPVVGNQYQAPGTNGVTSYGLFSRPAQPQANPPQTFPGGFKPPGGWQPRFPGGWQPQPPRVNGPDTGRLPGTIPGAQPGFGRPRLPPRPIPPPQGPGIGLRPPNIPTSLRDQLLQLRSPARLQAGALAPRQPGVIQQPTGNLGNVNLGNIGQATNTSQSAPASMFSGIGTGTAAQRLGAQPAQVSPQPQVIDQGIGNIPSPTLQQPQNQQMNASTALPPWMQSLMGIAESWASSQEQQQQANTPAGEDPLGFLGTIGNGLGGAFSDFVAGWDQANPGSNKSFFDFLNVPGFQQSSLMGDVGQNWTSAMDPAAWQQMAQNRLASANEANLSALNLAERRLADSAARTGLGNFGGARGNMYNDFASRGIQAERDIFNDALMNQMNAIQGAGQFALGANQQDQSRWSQLANMGMMGAGQDFAANREDNPSGASVLRDFLGAIGGAAGGIGQMYRDNINTMMQLFSLGMGSPSGG